MKYRLLDFLVCPDCGSALGLKVFKEEREKNIVTGVVKSCRRCALKYCLRKENGDTIDCKDCYRREIRDGVLECIGGHVFPVVDCIPRMLPDAFCGLESFIHEYEERLPLKHIRRVIDGKDAKRFSRIQKNTKESFAYQWLRYDVQDDREDREIFLSDSQLSEKELRDKLILDAGCGMGRYTRIASQMGGEVIGVDLSQSIMKAYQKTLDNPYVHIIQGDLLHLPFTAKQFDIIYSLGVLHHTPDPQHAFSNLVQCLKEKGIISIWVYGTAGKYRDFKTNPLRVERRKYITSDLIQRIHWFIVAARELLSNTVRLLTTRMYLPLLYLLCYPLAALGKIPFFKYLTASVHTNWRVRLQENFDWFSPQYQSHHTKEEVLGWFKEVKLDDIRMVSHGFIPKVGLRGKLH
jgi:SAM-dependent methyltransferase